MQRSGTTPSNNDRVSHNPFLNAEWRKEEKKKDFQAARDAFFVTSGLFLAQCCSRSLSAWGQTLFSRPHGDHVRWMNSCILALDTVRRGSHSQEKLQKPVGKWDGDSNQQRPISPSVSWHFVRFKLPFFPAINYNPLKVRVFFLVGRYYGSCVTKRESISYEANNLLRHYELSILFFSFFLCVCVSCCLGDSNGILHFDYCSRVALYSSVHPSAVSRIENKILLQIVTLWTFVSFPSRHQLFILFLDEPSFP